MKKVTCTHCGYVAIVPAHLDGAVINCVCCGRDFIAIDHDGNEACHPRKESTK